MVFRRLFFLFISKDYCPGLIKSCLFFLYSALVRILHPDDHVLVEFNCVRYDVSKVYRGNLFNSYLFFS
jgi:hypothetical protein